MTDFIFFSGPGSTLGDLYVWVGVPPIESGLLFIRSTFHGVMSFYFICSMVGVTPGIFSIMHRKFSRVPPPIDSQAEVHPLANWSRL